MSSGHDAPEQSGSISTTLWEQVRAQDPQAWQRLVRLFGPLICRWCRRGGLSAEDAADVLQEVFTAVWQHAGDFRRKDPADSFVAWLATITRNKIRDHFRRGQRRPQARGGTSAQLAMAEIPGEGAEAESSVAVDAEATALLSRRVLELTQVEFERRTWDALVQTTLDQRRAADVAADLGMSVGAVYMAKSRVLRRLRDVLAELDL
jgi:RNA polymerase sigma-70 factor (ECF subfamily)